MSLLAAVTLSSGTASAAVVETPTGDGELCAEFDETIDTDYTLLYSMGDDSEQISEASSAASNEIEIYTYQDLYDLRKEKVYNGALGMYVINKNVALRNDIDATEKLIGENGAYIGSTWVTIPVAFTGTFDGGGYNIKNLKIVANGTGNFGLFSSVQVGGTVKNLKFANVDITCSGSTTDIVSVGTIAGICKGTITDCTVNSGSLTAKMCNACAGGLVGISDGGTITYSYNQGVHLTGYGTMGGIAGSIIYSSTIQSCNNYGTISYSYDTKNGCAAGIVGKMNNGSSVTNCVNYGLIEYTGAKSSNASIQPCMAQIVGWRVSGTLSGNIFYRECQFNKLQSNESIDQRKYCSIYEYGRYGS